MNRPESALAALLLSVVIVAPAAAQQAPLTPQPVAHIDINALTADSDFTVFMRKDVSEDVRLAALRRLWILMQLPVSCHELCSEVELAAGGFARAASENFPVVTQ